MPSVVVPGQPGRQRHAPGGRRRGRAKARSVLTGDATPTGRLNS